MASLYSAIALRQRVWIIVDLLLWLGVFSLWITGLSGGVFEPKLGAGDFKLSFLDNDRVTVNSVQSLHGCKFPVLRTL